MRRRPRRPVIALGLLIAAAALPLCRPASAQTATLRIVRPLDLGALPLIVMQREHLIERTAEAMGLGEVAVTWSAPDREGPLAALASGRADLAMAGLAAFLVAQDAGPGTAGELRALGAVVQRPYVLVTRNGKINTLRDFTDRDHIAVPALRVSGPALMLELAAAQEWGPDKYDKLDRLVVARGDDVAAVALMSGAGGSSGGIDAHFSRSPYVDAELGDPAIHRVMDSFDIAGPHSDAVLATTLRLATADPELLKAVLSALEAADDYIKRAPGAAAEIFATATATATATEAREQDISLEDLSDMIGDPDLAYRAAPVGVLRLAQFMQRIGRLRHRIDRWQDLFLPAARDLPGS
jgi:NitT/TauT family transport system substrate-binding protein